MGQYYPAHRAAVEFPEINRPVTQAEYDAVLERLEAVGLTSGYVQEVGGRPAWTPDFLRAPAPGKRGNSGF
jgi:hypothetical protein